MFFWKRKKKDEEVNNEEIAKNEESLISDNSENTEEDTKEDTEEKNEDISIDEKVTEDTEITEVTDETFEEDEKLNSFDEKEEETTEENKTDNIESENDNEEPETEETLEEVPLNEENSETQLQETEENEIQEEIEVEQKPKKGFFAKLIEGLNKTRNSIMGGVDAVLGSFTQIDEDLFEELEEVLIMADMGVTTTETIIENLRKKVKLKRTTDPKDIKDLLAEEISELMKDDKKEDETEEYPLVMLVIGVNGVGKTTTIGKIGNNYKKQGKKVMFAAADTFRAAAIDQLEIWGKRVNVDVIRHEENSDPAAVVFDAVNAAKNRKIDVLICDTAGRLHNKKNLMDELKKISKVINREYPEARKEVLLVLDATTGQNALQQAKLFSEVAEISGIVLTKLDGTAKGGIVVAIKSELNIPVKYIGVGEGLDDLQPFNSEDFAKALFSE